MREDWEKCILDDLLVFMTNGSSAKQFNEEVGLPISRIETIWDEKIDFGRVKYIKESEPEFIEKYRICKNDILLSHINSDSHLGKTAIYKNDKKVFIHGINLLKLRPTPRINADFLIHQFRFKKIKGDFIAVAQRAVNQSSINQRKLKVFDFILPSLSEQRAIVAKIEELFSDLDKGIADLKKAQDQLVIFRQAVLKKAFEGELTKEWREQQTDLPTANELLEEIKIGRQDFFNKQFAEWELELKEWKEKGENGKKPKKPRPLTIPDLPNAGHEERKWGIPNNWIWTQIGDLCFVTKLAGFEYTDYVNYDQDGDLPVLKAENAGPNGFKKTDFSRVKAESVKTLTRSQIFGGEMLIVFVGAGTGQVAMVPLNQRYFLGPNIGMARPYFKLNSKFIELFLQSAFGKNLMMSAVKAVAQPSLSMGTIRQAPVAYPSFEEQNKIVQEIESRLSVCDNVELSIVESLEKAKALRQSILKKAFEGTLLSAEEIAVCKAAKDYEPASVLLKKIKAEKKK